VSTREDKFEQQVRTSVESYFLFNIENDPLPNSDALAAGRVEDIWGLSTARDGCFRG